MTSLQLSKYQAGILGIWSNHQEIQSQITGGEFSKLFILTDGEFPKIPTHSCMSNDIYSEARKVFVDAMKEE